MCESRRGRALAQYAALQGASELGSLSAEEGIFSARRAFLTHFTGFTGTQVLSGDLEGLWGCVPVPPSLCGSVSLTRTRHPPPSPRVCMSACGAVMNALG